jgi:hypothetical protein
MPDHPQHRARHLVLAVVLALGSLALAAGPAHAQPLRCGDTVTQDTTLTADLLDCPGDGLVIGAPGITVDLGGHTVAAPETLTGDPGGWGSTTAPGTTTSPSGTAGSGSSTTAASTWSAPTATRSRAWT